MIGFLVAVHFALLVTTVKADASITENKQQGVRGLATTSEKKVKVCHIPPGNPSNFHTIEIGNSALKAHLAHGDRMGQCNTNCDFLCNDNNACTIDHNGLCEEKGCIPEEERLLTPACHPSESPSESPSERPSFHPSESPSERPSFHPSERPTLKPSSSPTSKPTSTPNLCAGIICQANFSCDPKDGACKSDNQLVPCIAVIDEDSNISNEAALWTTFRQLYPSRPFCLLIPTPNANGQLDPPANFRADPNVKFFFNVVRDNGNAQSAMDWYTMCGLDIYAGTNTVKWVGLFIDNSGSMTESQVAASRDLLANKLTAIGVQIKKVVNGNEDWITPFTTTLAPGPL